MTFEYRVSWEHVVSAETPQAAVVQAKAELQKLLDSSAPIAFGWESFEGGLLVAKATTVLHADGSVGTATGAGSGRPRGFSPIPRQRR